MYLTSLGEFISVSLTPKHANWDEGLSLGQKSTNSNKKHC